MSDSLTTAAGMVIDAQGRVTYDFSGHVHAQGLDLDAGDSATPPSDKRVRWLRADGTPAIQLWGYQVPGSDAGLEILAGTGPFSADLIVESDSAGHAVIAAVAGPHSRNVLDQDGRSGFMQSEEGHTYAVFYDGVNLKFQVDGIVVKTI